MKATWRIYLAMGLLAAVAVGAMAYVTHRAVSLEARQREAQRYAAEQEKVRLALWRMDSAAMAMLARWTPELPDPHDLLWSLMKLNSNVLKDYGYANVTSRAEAVSSSQPPDLTRIVPLYFIYDGRLWSPQAAAWLPESATEGKKEGFRRLAELRGKLDPSVLAARLRADDPAGHASLAQDPSPAIIGTQIAMNEVELSNRFQNANALVASPAPGGPPVALWQGDMLLLVRRYAGLPGDMISGAWLDWPAIEASLLGQVRDLLPDVRLEAIDAELDPEDTNRLASLPLRVVPGAVPVSESGEPVLTGPLAAAWASLLAALLAGAGVLRTVVSLGERRRDFVSAVTHELRTPLTTFRLYSEMLAEGMVTDETKRQEYLHKLHEESRRLSHLVANVLAYSGLSGPRRGPSRQAICLGEMLAHARQGLDELARRGGMELVVESGPADGSASACVVRADLAAVEQVLVNLVDNACKYAGAASDRRIRVQLSRQGAHGVIRVCDGGPGVPSPVRRKLFRQFSRSADDAAGNSPGVGLGLAISRRLARQMGGDLRYVPGDHGACFDLRLPAAGK